MRRQSIEELLGKNKYAVENGRRHIVIKAEICKSCAEKPCLYACPGKLYTWKEEEIQFDDAGCLECGTCRAVCPHADRALEWGYPQGGFGVHFRYG